jgi:hypothetical protein
VSSGRLQHAARAGKGPASRAATGLSGTGAYTSFRGSGNGVGDELPTEIVDHFTGAVHFN